MCYKGNCMMCIPVEKGCLVFAVISAIVTLLSLLAFLIVGVLALAGLAFVPHEIQHRSTYGEREYGTLATIEGGMNVGIFALIMCMLSLITFIFSVLLCNGICKRRPGQVKAYFIYGVTITVLAVLATIIQMMTTNNWQPVVLTLVACVIYSLFLLMVFHTYTKFTAGAVYISHVRLVEGEELGAKTPQLA